MQKPKDYVPGESDNDDIGEPDEWGVLDDMPYDDGEYGRRGRSRRDEESDGEEDEEETH